MARARTLIAPALALGLLAAACGGSDGGGSASVKTTSIYASLDTKPLVQPLVVAFEKANPGYKAKVTYVPAALLGGAAAKAKANVVIANVLGMKLADKKLAFKGSTIPLGWNEMVIAVAKGNPKNITTLAAFDAGSTTSSVVCSPRTTCGQWTERVLKKAAVTPAPDRVSVMPVQVLNEVATGRIDAAMLPRTLAAARPAKVHQVAIAPKDNVRVGFQAALLDSGAAATRFATFVKSPQAKTVMRARGYLPLLPGAGLTTSTTKA